MRCIYRPRSLIIIAVLSLAITGCHQSPELPSETTETQQSGYWVINPQPECSKELQRAYKKEADDIVREVDIVFRDRSRARLHYDTLGTTLVSMTGELTNKTNFEASFDRGSLTRLSVMNQAGILEFQLETISPSLQRVTFYRLHQKLAEVTGSIILAAEQFEPITFLDNKVEIPHHDCKPAALPNTWTLFKEDGKISAQIEITPYNIQFGYSANSLLYPISQRYICTSKHLFAPDGYIYYQETCSKVENLPKKISSFKSQHDCSFYSQDQKLLYKGIITRDVIRQPAPDMGTIEQIDAYAEDGITVEDTRHYGFLEVDLNLMNSDYDRPAGHALAIAAYNGGQELLLILEYQKTYSQYLDFIRPLLKRK